jgi:hypothetical protein
MKIIGTRTIPKCFITLIFVISIGGALAIANLAFSTDAKAIELSKECKKIFEKFKSWPPPRKVFAYGVGKNTQSACWADVSEQEALRKCNKSIRPWGGECRIYAKSPVNGNLAIVWRDQPSDIQTVDLRRRSKEFALNSDKAICSMATTAKRTEWDDGNWSKKFRHEASRRELSLTRCQKLLGVFAEIARNAEREKIENERAENQRKKEVERKAKLAKAKKSRLIVEQNIRREQIKIEQEKRKAGAERKRQQAETDRRAEQERIRKAEAVEHQRLTTERKRKLAEARNKILGPLRKKNKHSVAVIIGNKNYEGRIPAVDFAHNDADAMRKFVLERLAYRDGNIIDLRDAGRNRIEAVFGNERTPEGELFSIIREGKSDVIVYYSGHGVPGLKDKRPYLLPVNGNPNLAEITGYPVDTLYKNLAKLPAQSVTVFLDACFSGDSDKGMLISSASGLSLEPELPSASGRLTVITAAQGNQLASWDPKARHGLFTKHLLDALNGKADAEEYGNADGKVSLSEVQTYLDDEMTYQARRTWNRRQNAYVRGSGNLVLASVFNLPGAAGDTLGIEEMDATYTVLKSANLRAGPSTDTSIVGKLKANTSVNITGKVSGRNWYRLSDGSFVFGSLIRVSE